ncbi:MAG TPA: hypothetical protein VGR43_06710 [Dehalococcoidia bacterium]|nr:hypothetical protein [Dehalococcoidia bacterium]
MVEYDLWVTNRCARDDLGIEEWPGEDGVFGARQHAAVGAFFERRRQQPEAGEHIVCLRDERCYELHLGRDRGATWYDREANAVFLLAVGWHENGSRADFYNTVCEHERRERLYPTEDDYAELERWRLRRDMTRLRHEIGPMLFDQADAEPNIDFSVDLGRCVAGIRCIAEGSERIGYRLVILSNRSLDVAAADRIAQALGQGRRIAFAIVTMPEWGTYVFEGDVPEAVGRQSPE